MSIPRDDVVALQQTVEYREFLHAFGRLGEAHRRTVTLERQQMEEDGDDDEEFDDGSGVAQYLRNEQPGLVTPIPATASSLRFRSGEHPPPPPPPPPSMAPTSTYLHHIQNHHHRRRYSFLQHFAVDDVLLRIFEFIDCLSLVRTGATCHRFRELTIRSAEQRTHRLADGRILRSAMRMLRAQEQIEGVGPREGLGPFVPIPMLGLPRRIRVSGAGDSEYDGIYFCTGFNGNGFLFTKPRIPERRVQPVITHGGDDNVNHNNENNENFGLVDGGWMEEIPATRRIAGNDANDNRRALVEEVNGDADLDGDNDEDDVDDAVQGGNVRQGREGVVDVLVGDEPNRIRLLRCIIAKRFSNETILWYMSKEVEDESTREITQCFSFWAKLHVTGDATPDVCQYPSQTSILSRNGDPAWQHLSNTLDVAPPTVELLDV